MDMIQHLFTPYRKRLYFLISLGAILLLLILQFLFLPWIFAKPLPATFDVINRVLDNLLVAAVASALLTAAILYFTPPNPPEAQTKVVRPPDRGRVIEQTRHDTDSWWFSGGIGRYTRASTLPELATEALRNNKTTTVHMHILDPRNDTVCEAYAHYRATAWSAKNDSTPWTTRRVQVELAATIVAAAAYQNNSRLTVRVRYAPHVSVFRTDLGDRGAILTQEDTRMEALFFGRESGGYAALREQLRIEERSLQEANLPKIKTLPDQLTLAILKGAVPNSDLDNLRLDDSELETIIKHVKSRRHPYS